MLPKAILFDLDDTIISLDGASEIAWIKICNMFINNEKPDFTGEQLLNCINETRKWYWGDPDRHKIGRMDLIKARREIVRAAMKKLDYLDEEKAYQMADNYSRMQEELVCLFPNSADTLQKF